MAISVASCELFCHFSRTAVAVVPYIVSKQNKKKKKGKEVPAYIGAGYQLHFTLGVHEFSLRYEKSRQDIIISSAAFKPEFINTRVLISC